MSSKNDTLAPSATRLPLNKNTENQPFENKGLKGKNDKGYGAPPEPISGNNPTPRRRRTERAAKKVINDSAMGYAITFTCWKLKPNPE